jgi:hypothetical protein
VGEVECNLDKVVTGGGYDITMRSGGPSSPSTIVTNFKELALNNAWHVEVFDSGIFGTMCACICRMSQTCTCITLS